MFIVLPQKNAHKIQCKSVFSPTTRNIHPTTKIVGKNTNAE